MKCIIIGLGNFGSSLAQKMTQSGHEVIGVDTSMEKVEAYKDSITHTVCLNCTDPHAAGYLPLKDTDVVIVAIGEDQGANIMVTALMKQLQVKRLISRAISPLHETILQAMDVEEIVHPEQETSDRWANKLGTPGILDTFSLSDEYSIVKAVVPKLFVGKTLKEAGIRRNFNIIVLTTMKIIEKKNLFGGVSKITKVQEVASPEMVLSRDDILVLYGHMKDIHRMLNLE